MLRRKKGDCGGKHGMQCSMTRSDGAPYSALDVDAFPLRLRRGEDELGLILAGTYIIPATAVRRHAQGAPGPPSCVNWGSRGQGSSPIRYRSF